MGKKEIITPKWAKEAVWYQIFPERFRNGDRKNDPVLKSIEGAYPHDIKSSWQIHPWTSDWYNLASYEKLNKRDVWFNIQRRRYGGDLQGIIDKLDYLGDLGINAIYLNPVFMSPSSHKYDSATYHHIDPHFGPNPEEDFNLINKENPADFDNWTWTSADKLFLELIERIHKKGMKIIIDGVFNHVGLNSWIFKDVKKYRKNSKFKNWLNVTSWEDNFSCKTWEGFNELPELRQNENGIVDGPKDYIFKITRRWMDPFENGKTEKGVDGWRLDVAFCIKHEFWKEWRKHVKSINPNTFLTAEIIKDIEVTKHFLRGDEFDAEMNYNFAFLCYKFFIKDKNKFTVVDFLEKLKQLRESYPTDITYAMQNLFDSHDAPRLASIIKNKEFLKFEEWSLYHEKTKGTNPEFNTTKPDDTDFRLLKLMVIFQMTYIGAPMVYYGSETGMWGANDPCCRKPMVWEDLDYEHEEYLPDQSCVEERKVSFNHEIYEHYKKLIGIRNNNIELRLGTFKVVDFNNEKEMFLFERSYDGENIIVGINAGNEKIKANLDNKRLAEYKDLLNNRTIERSRGHLEVEIPGKWGVVLK